MPIVKGVIHIRGHRRCLSQLKCNAMEGLPIIRIAQDIPYIADLDMVISNYYFSTEKPDVWIVAVNVGDIDDQLLSGMLKTLSISENSKLTKFKDSLSAQSFLVGRYIVRTFLSLGSSLSADEIVIEEGENGKPWSQMYDFNLSHAENIVIAAFGRTIDIGIDIEVQRDGMEYLAIAELVFPQEDYEHLVRCRRDLLSQYFLDRWTYHEARIKMDSLTIDDIKIHKSMPFKAWRLDFCSSNIHGHICCRRKDQSFTDISLASL